MAGPSGWGGLAEEGWRKGPWTAEEDRLLIKYVEVHGEGRWNAVARLAGLKRYGQSCRLRWVNYLRPDLKKGQITPHEESIITELHARLGNRWSTIARSLPGRTDNEIKNYWRTHFKKKAKVSPDNSDEARTRFLKKQQFHQQQQQHLQQQQQYYQQQLLQLNQLDKKKIASLLEENENKEHSLEYNLLFNVSGSVPEASSDEGLLWDGLWNPDDVHGDFGAACATSKPNMQNLSAPFCFSGAL